MKKFEVGKSYFGRMIGDADQLIHLTVSKRTTSTLVTADGKRLKIYAHYDGSTEYVLPFGKYSMSPQISAEKLAVN